MAKHTLKDILGIFAHHAQHTHEAAVQATYDAGHAAGSEEVKAKLLAGDKALGEELMARDEAAKDAAAADKAAKTPTPEAADDQQEDAQKDDQAQGQTPPAPKGETGSSEQVQT